MKQRIKRGYAKLDDPRWNEFKHFYADMGDRPVGTTLDRKNNELGYSKANCRWATANVQQANRTNNVMLTHKGETLAASVWARRLGITKEAMYLRVQKLQSRTHPALFTSKAPGKGHELANR